MVREGRPVFGGRDRLQLWFWNMLGGESHARRALQPQLATGRIDQLDARILKRAEGEPAS